MFEISLGLDNIPKNKKVICREAVRGVIIKEKNKIIMIHNSNNDYKLPGGGIEQKENHFQALKREFMEETGILIKDEFEKIGVITESNKDIFEDDAYFMMKSHYYICKADDYTNNIKLDNYEKELSFKLVEIDIFQAYNHNKKILDLGDKTSSWLKREIIALENIIKEIAEFKKTNI